MRIYRQMNDTSKLSISKRLKGRKLTDSHKQAIRNSMLAYWARIPNKPIENNGSKNNFNNETNM